MSIGDIILLVLILGVSCYMVYRSFSKPNCNCGGCSDVSCEKKDENENRS